MLKRPRRLLCCCRPRTPGTSLLMPLLLLCPLLACPRGGRRRSWLLAAPLALLALTAMLLLGASKPAAAGGANQPPQLLQAPRQGAVVAAAAAPIAPVAQQPTKANLTVDSSSAAASSLSAAASSSAGSSTATSGTEEFLRLAALANSSPAQQHLLTALRVKVPLLNQLASLQASRGSSLAARARTCTGRGSKQLVLRHVQAFSYVHNEPDLCTGQLLLLTAVHSNAKNANRRDTIRRTWGSLRYVGSSRLQLVFFLGLPTGEDAAAVQAAIDAESRRHRDLVQLGFEEHYRNMSLKHLSIYEWALGHCSAAQYLVKVDDDTFADVVHLVAFLQHSPPGGFYCSNTRGAKPQRLKRGPKAKWAVTRCAASV